jgi:nitroimidazol reductase NimA-like FMN-containing flavoprotein (pyridoxamine 5'-phosphate oxidase superfamily)
MDAADGARMATAIIDANVYMTLATADAGGTPWASPVWFAADGYRRFLWVSRPDTRHSRNVAARAEVGIVIFDSTVPEDEAAAVYLDARAEAAPEAELEPLMEVFSERSVARLDTPWPVAKVTGDAPHRLYVATVRDAFVLAEHDQRLAVDLD